MAYLIPALTAAMLGYMFWMLVFRLRRDRVHTERKATRGKYRFSPKDRVRLMLDRAFGVSRRKAEWEDPLIERLNERAAEADARERGP